MLLLTTNFSIKAGCHLNSSPCQCRKMLKSPREGVKKTTIAKTLAVIEKNEYTATISFEVKENLVRFAERPLICEVTLLKKLHPIEKYRNTTLKSFSFAPVRL